jgi:hypothetical protein
MKVETYEIEEVTGELGVMAADSEAIELIEKMGLAGQQALMNPTTETRLPYRVLTRLERNIFGVMFPAHTELRQYDRGPIPLRVLQVAAHCNEQGFFTRIEVWHPEDGREKDPLLIGLRKNPEYEWMTTPHLLARWGDALPSMEELAVKAKKIWITIRQAQLRKILREVERDIDVLAVDAEIGFAGGELKDHRYSA